MRFVCDATGRKAWFRIETEAEAARESELMRHAVEKHFRRAHEQASQGYRPAPGPYVEQDIGRAAHIRRAMPVFLTLRDAEGNALATAMLPQPAGQDSPGLQSDGRRPRQRRSLPGAWGRHPPWAGTSASPSTAPAATRTAGAERIGGGRPDVSAAAAHMDKGALLAWKREAPASVSTYEGFRSRLVGARGFEPPAPASRTQCSTRLSYAPSSSGNRAGSDAGRRCEGGDIALARGRGKAAPALVTAARSAYLAAACRPFPAARMMRRPPRRASADSLLARGGVVPAPAGRLRAGCRRCARRRQTGTRCRSAPPCAATARSPPGSSCSWRR